MDRTRFLLLLYGGDGRISRSQSDALSRMVDRRLAGEPLAYITGVREFYGLEFAVDARALVPRQETELLVDAALEFLAWARRRGVERPTLADVGVGSGAVALAVAAHCESARIVGVDVSAGALALARENARRLGLSHRVELARADMLSPFGASLDVIASNPPYIPSGEIARLPADVRREPQIALDGGDDGLRPFRRLLAQASANLAPRGALVVEAMPSQMAAAMAMARAATPRPARVSALRDLSGDERALVAEWGD